MRVGVTGGAGFIGGHVIDRLVDAGHGVLVLDHHATPGVGVRGEADLFMGDVRDATAVHEFAAHVDGIIHLAAVLGTQETIRNPRPAVETNVLGGLNVFEAATHYSLPVVYAAVGNHWMRNGAAGAYTITKSCLEDFARSFNAYNEGRISVVRPVNAYGPRQSVATPYGPSKVRKIMPSFICRALVGDPIELYGGGVQVSDCVYVTDVADVFVTTLEQTAVDGPVDDAVEVGPPVSATVAEIARLVRACAHSHTGAWSDIVDLPMRPGETPGATVSADTGTLRQIGKDAGRFMPLAAGIRRTVEWYADNWLPGYLP